MIRVEQNERDYVCHFKRKLFSLILSLLFGTSILSLPLDSNAATSTAGAPAATGASVGVGAVSAPVPSAFAVSTPKEDAINANEVSTEDIVVPPPMDFGNDDNRISEIQQQHPQLQSRCFSSTVVVFVSCSIFTSN